MARSWIDILKELEGIYPAAIGGAAHNDNLRQLLVPFANDFFREIDQQARWSYAFNSYQFITVLGQQRYNLSNNTAIKVYSGKFNFAPERIKRVYYLDSAGCAIILDREERVQASGTYGDTFSGDPFGPGGGVARSVNPSTPLKYSVTRVEAEPNPASPGTPRTTSWVMDLFPPPNQAGFDTNNNYTIYIECYVPTLPIVETVATVNNSAAITVPDTRPLTNISGETFLASGDSCIIRGGGYAGISGNTDSVSSILSFTPTATITLHDVVPGNVTLAQTFFNALDDDNWMFRYCPKLVKFGVLREVATYLQKTDDVQLWEQRYQQELETLRENQMDTAGSVDNMAVAHSGQHSNVNQRIDQPVNYDIRGGT